MANVDSAVSSLAGLLRQTPPGQVAKVYHDLRVLLEGSGVQAASEQLRAAAWPVLSEYNTQELITVKTPAAAPEAAPSQPLIISPAAALVDEVEGDSVVRFTDPRAQTSYAFDPLRLRLSDPQPIVVNEAYERLRSALDVAATKYTGHYYQDGVTSTFVQTALGPDPEPELQPEPEIPETSESPAPEVAAESTAMPDAKPEDHAGGPPDVAEVARAQHEVEQTSEEADHDVTGQHIEGEGVEPHVAYAVDAAVGNAEAAAEGEAEKEEAKERRDEEAQEDASLAQALERTHLDPEGAEQEVKIEAAEEDGEESVSSRVPSGGPTFTIHIVGNRYNLPNFWAGRWRSTYVLSLPHTSDAEKAANGLTVQGKVQVQVHYFEEGNVQLSAEHAPQLAVASDVDVASILSGSATPEAYSALADTIVRTIKVDEQAYHAALETTLNELSERTFRALRRQLPVTKQKLDWNRAVSYNLAGDLAR